jgi:hypothetical protein
LLIISSAHRYAHTYFSAVKTIGDIEMEVTEEKRRAFEQCIKSEFEQHELLLKRKNDGYAHKPIDDMCKYFIYGFDSATAIAGVPAL